MKSLKRSPKATLALMFLHHGPNSKPSPAEKDPKVEGYPPLPAAKGMVADPYGKQEKSEGIRPAAVNYRSERETCGNCEYMAGDQCTKLKMTVDKGAGCNLFEDKSSDEVA